MADTKFPSAALVRQFMAVAETGSFSAAARHVNLTQSALTKNVAKLEKELGVPLFVRLGRGCALTRFGEMFYRKSRIIAAEYRLALAELHNELSGRGITLRIGAGPAWCVAVIPTVIDRFRKLYPASQFVIKTGEMMPLIVELDCGDLDLVMGNISDYTDKTYQVERLSTLSMDILAARSHPMAQIGDCSIDELNRYPWIAYQHNREALQQYVEACSAMGAKPPNVAIESHSLLAFLTLISQGPYIGLQPGILTRYLPEFNLVTLPFRPKVRDFETGLIYRRAATEWPVMRRFVDILRDEAVSRLQ